jgi:N-acetylmuramoyl-L-alanine amidase
MPTPADQQPALLPASAAQDIAALVPAAVARPIALTVIHCSATPSGHWIGGVPRGLKGWRSPAEHIDAWHAVRGFRRAEAARARFNPPMAASGYHYVIDLDGRVYTGRHLDEIGAHVAGHNADTAGICLVGGAEAVGTRYSAAQWGALRVLVRGLRRICVGHRDLSPDANRDGKVQAGEWLKTCPGFDVRAWVQAAMQPPRENLLPEMRA